MPTQAKEEAKPERKQEAPQTGNEKIAILFVPSRHPFSEDRPTIVILKVTDLMKMLLLQQMSVEEARKKEADKRDEVKNQELAYLILHEAIKAGILKSEILKGDVKAQEIKFSYSKEIDVPRKSLVKIARVVYGSFVDRRLEVENLDLQLPGMHKMKPLATKAAAAA